MSTFDERIKAASTAPRRAPFARDPHEDTAPATERRARRTSSRDLFSARVLIQLTEAQHDDLKSFRRVGISYSAIVRALITMLKRDPKLLEEVLREAEGETE